MAHACQPSGFRQRLENTLLVLSRQMERIQVSQLPQTIQDNIERNRARLQLCDTGLDQDEQEIVLKMMNTDWRETFPRGGFQKLQHYCVANCCRNARDCQRRMHSALHALYGRLYDTPLLYRALSAASSQFLAAHAASQTVAAAGAPLN